MTTATPPQSDATHLDELPLDVTGMTCASCVRRVERALTKLDGIETAAVNLATERATVRFDPALVAPDAAAAVVVKAGYGATATKAEPREVGK